MYIFSWYILIEFRYQINKYTSFDTYLQIYPAVYHIFRFFFKECIVIFPEKN